MRRSARDAVVTPARIAALAADVRKLVDEIAPATVVGWGSRGALAIAAALTTMRARPAFVFQHNDLMPRPPADRAIRALARRADLVIGCSQSVIDDLDPGGAARRPRHLRSFPASTSSASPRSRRSAPPLRRSSFSARSSAGSDRSSRSRPSPSRRARSPTCGCGSRAVRSTPPATSSYSGCASALKRPTSPAESSSPGHSMTRAMRSPAPPVCLHCADREAFGIVLIEALASALPVVAPDAFGPTEILDSTCGRLYPPGDAAAAGAALVEVIGDPELARSLGVAGRERAERLFDRELTRSRYRELLGDVRPEVAPNRTAVRTRRRRRNGGDQRPRRGPRRHRRRRTSRDRALPPPAALAPERYRVVAPPPALAHRAGHAWEQGLLALLARDAALIYSPANLAPFASRRNVVVIHDVAGVRHPEWYGSTYAAWQARVLPVLAKRARHLIADSEFGRSELVDVLGARPEDVSVVPLGVSERFTPAADPAPALAAHALERPYVLAVGSLIARKNLAVLEQAAARARREGDRPRRGRIGPRLHARRGRALPDPLRSATSTTPSSPASTREPSPSRCLRSTKASGCPASRPWQREHR